MSSWRDALSWHSLLGSIDEKKSSLLGELSWSRLTPSSWLSTSTDHMPTIDATNPSSADTSSDNLSNAIVLFAGAATVTIFAVSLRSLLTMTSWRHSLRHASSGTAAPGPTPLPFLGNVLDLRAGYYQTLYRFVDKPAAVFWVLSTPFVVVNDAHCVRTVLGGGGKYAKPKYFGYKSKVVKSAVDKQSGKVAAENTAVFDARADSSRKALHSMVGASFGTIKDSMDRLTAVIAEEGERAEVDDAQREALDIVRKALVSLNLEVLFGLPQAEGDATSVADKIAFAGAEFARRMVNPLRVLVDIPGNLRYVKDVGGLIGLGRDLCRRLDVAAAQIRRECEGSAGAGLNWVHAWVGKVGSIGKLGKVVGLLMASSQTVPITAVWVLHLVAKHDDVRVRLLRELKEIGVHSAADLTFEHMDRMPLAEAVIRETLRLYPPFPLIQRQAQVDDVLGDITVPKGTNVYIVPWLIHRNPKLWPDPHEFKPSRFSKGSMAHGDAESDWAFVPFGRGPRMCAGSQLAIVELKVLLAFALLRCDWSTSSESDRNASPGANDSIFPELGMMPKGIQLFAKRFEREMEIADAL